MYLYFQYPSSLPDTFISNLKAMVRSCVSLTDGVNDGKKLEYPGESLPYPKSLATFSRSSSHDLTHAVVTPSVRS